MASVGLSGALLVLLLRIPSLLNQPAVNMLDMHRIFQSTSCIKQETLPCGKAWGPFTWWQSQSRLWPSPGGSPLRVGGSGCSGRNPCLALSLGVHDSALAIICKAQDHLLGRKLNQEIFGGCALPSFRCSLSLPGVCPGGQMGTVPSCPVAGILCRLLPLQQAALP